MGNTAATPDDVKFEALMWRHRKALEALSDVDPDLRPLLLGVVVAPSPELEKLSLEAVAESTVKRFRRPCEACERTFHADSPRVRRCDVCQVRKAA